MPKNPFRIVAQNPGFLTTLRRKPRLATSVARQRALQARRRRQGLRTLAGIEFAVTYACQASCEHCSATSLLDKKREAKRLRVRELGRAMDEARALGAYEVNLTGGEPTLEKRLADYVQALRPERTFVGVNTNGMLLDGARVRELCDAGVDLLKMSLDSPDPEEHDRNRGLPGSHAHVVELMDLVRGVPGIRAHICSVGTTDLIRSGGAEALVDLAERKGATIGFTLPAAVGRWSGQYELMLDPADLEALRTLCRRPHAFFQGSVGMASFRCPAAREEVYVSPYGDVLPCPFIQRSFGNVREEGLEAIYERMGRAAGLAGEGSLCLAGEAVKWMKANTTSSKSEDTPDCATSHDSTFCRKVTDAAAAGPAV